MKKAISELTKTLEVLKKYDANETPVPEAGCFYSTLNGSIVYLCQNNYRSDELQAIIIKGGWNDNTCGDTYWVTKDGYHNDDEPGAHLIMALREKLDIILPEIE